MGVDDEARELRSRQARLDDAVDRAGGGSDPLDSFVGSTVAIGTYPTTAAAWYGVKAQTIFGDETEGATAALADAGFPTARAYNLGGSVPPPGTKVLVRREPGGRWTFRYG